MAILGATIVADAMFQAGVLGQDGVTVPDADAALVLRRLNRMLDSWSVESMMIYTITTKTLALSANVSTYTSASLSGGGVRPVNVAGLYVTFAGVDYPITMIDNTRYNDIGIKTIAAIPQYCYLDMSYPNATFVFFPVPYATMTANVDCEDLLQSTPITAATLVSMPPGYEKAIVDCLAEDICPSFGKTVTPDIAKAATQARSRLKIRNWVPAEMKTDFDQDSSYDLSYICRPW